MKRNRERKRAKKYAEFISQGGTRSGVFDISDKKTRVFVKKYKEFIPKKELYKRDKNGTLVAVDRRQRKKDKQWRKAYLKRQKDGKNK